MKENQTAGCAMADMTLEEYIQWVREQMEIARENAMRSERDLSIPPPVLLTQAMIDECRNDHRGQIEWTLLRGGEVKESVYRSHPVLTAIFKGRIYRREGGMVALRRKKVW